MTESGFGVHSKYLFCTPIALVSFCLFLSVHFWKCSYTVVWYFFNVDFFGTLSIYSMLFAHMTIGEYFSCYHFNLISVFQMFGRQRRELFGLSSTDSRNPIGCSVLVTRRSLVNTEHFSDSRNPISCWVLETRRSLVNTKNFPGKCAPLVQHWSAKEEN